MDRDMDKLRAEWEQEYDLSVIHRDTAAVDDGRIAVEKPPFRFKEMMAAMPDAERGKTVGVAEMDYVPAINDDDCWSDRPSAAVLSLLVDCGAITVDELREFAGLPPFGNVSGKEIAKRLK